MKPLPFEYTNNFSDKVKEIKLKVVGDGVNYEVKVVEVDIDRKERTVAVILVEDYSKNQDIYKVDISDDKNKLIIGGTTAEYKIHAEDDLDVTLVCSRDSVRLPGRKTCKYPITFRIEQSVIKFTYDMEKLPT